MTRSWRATTADALHWLPAPVHRWVPGPLRADLRHRLDHFQPGDVGYLPTPPTRRPGQTVGPPDVVVVGAPDQASRSWFEVLADHPGLATPLVADRGWGSFSGAANRGFTPADVDAFARLFPRSPGERVAYWAPDVLADPWMAPVLARCAPDARYLVVMSDPVRQLQARLAQTTETRAPHPGSNDADAVAAGFYGRLTNRLYAVVDRAHVHLVQWERCLIDPVGELAAGDAFLGLDPVARIGRPRPAPLPPAPRLDDEVERRLAALYADDAAHLATSHPGRIDLGLWSGIGR
jgi:hypothetical protein